MGEKEPEIQPRRGRQTWSPATWPFSPAESIFQKGEKACWEKQLAQVGGSPAAGAFQGTLGAAGEQGICSPWEVGGGQGGAPLSQMSKQA